MIDLLLSLIVPLSFLVIICWFCFLGICAFRGYAFRVNPESSSIETFSIDTETKRLRSQYVKSGVAITFIVTVVLIDGFNELSFLTDSFTDLSLGRENVHDLMDYYITMATLPFVMITVLFGFMYSIHEKLHELKKELIYKKN